MESMLKLGEKMIKKFYSGILLLLLVSMANIVHAEAILLPEFGMEVFPGQEIEINFEITQGGIADGVLFTFSYGKMHSIEGSGPYEFIFVVPEDHVGPIDITALAYGGKGFMAKTTIIVKPEAPLISLELNSSELFLSKVTARDQVVVMGHYQDGRMARLHKENTGTTYSTQSGGNEVVNIGLNGKVTVVGEGKDAIIVQNSGQTITMPVTVEFYSK